MVICLERGADDLHLVQLMPLPPIISCFIKIQNGFPFWCQLIQVVMEKRPLNGCSVVVVVVVILNGPSWDQLFQNVSNQSHQIFGIGCGWLISPLFSDHSGHCCGNLFWGRISKIGIPHLGSLRWHSEMDWTVALRMGMLTLRITRSHQMKNLVSFGLAIPEIMTLESPMLRQISKNASYPTNVIMFAIRLQWHSCVLYGQSYIPKLNAGFRRCRHITIIIIYCCPGGLHARFCSVFSRCD